MEGARSTGGRLWGRASAAAGGEEGSSVGGEGAKQEGHMYLLYFEAPIDRPCPAPETALGGLYVKATTNCRCLPSHTSLLLLHRFSAKSRASSIQSAGRVRACGQLS